MGLNIKEVTPSEWNGKRKLEVLVNSGAAQGEVKATIWEVQMDGSKFPGFDEIKPGSIIEGSLYNKPGTVYWTIYPPKPQKQGGMNGGMGAKLVKEKQEGIAKSMDRKEEGIKISSTFREAIAITLSQLDGKDFSEEEFQRQAMKWRQWLNKFYDDKLTSAGTEVPFQEAEQSPEEEWINVPF